MGLKKWLNHILPLQKRIITAKHNVKDVIGNMIDRRIKYLTEENKRKKINELRRAMEKAAKELDFAEAARLRDAIKMFHKSE